LDAGGGFSRKTAESNSATGSPTSVATSQRSRTVSATQIASAEGEKNLSPAGTGSGIYVSRTGSETLRQSAINPALKSGATVRTPSKEETAGNLHSVSAVKSVKTVAASGVAATVTPVAIDIATAQSIPAAIPAPVAEAQSSIPTKALTQTPLTDLSGELSSAFTPGHLQSSLSLPDGPATVTGGTIASRNQAAVIFSAAEAVDSLPSDRTGASFNEIGTVANQATGTAVEAEGAQSSPAQVPVVPATVKSVIQGQAEKVTVASPAAQEEASTAHVKTSQAVEHSGAQNRNIEEVKSSDPNGWTAIAAGVEPSPSGRMRPQAESTPHTFAAGPPRMQAQAVIQGAEAIASPVGSAPMGQESAMNNTAASSSVAVTDTASFASKADSAGGSKATMAQTASRSAHFAAAVHGDRQGQAVPAVQDGANNAALARDPSAVRTAVNLAGESAGAESKDRSTAQETFAALDSESSSSTTTWVHAGTRSAEAGFQDPALGWIGVRADASGGGVHASLVPGSAEAAVTLGGHLAGLNSYLAEQHTPVDSLTLAAPEERSAHTSMGHGSQQSMQQEAGQNTGQRATASSRQSGTRVSASVLTPAAGNEVPAASGRTETTAQGFIPRGTHISVMA